MKDNKFIEYLNTLHNYNGHNSNNYAEKNYTSEFFRDLLVEIPAGNFIADELLQPTSHIIVLTGHAGDGKTSLMYQVLGKLNCAFDTAKEKFEVTLPNGKTCVCIKDFSEFPDDKKTELMRSCLEEQNQGKQVFVVANTGPLINSFLGSVKEEDRAEAENKFLNALDLNTGKTTEICGYRFCIVNVVKTNNIFFAERFLDKVITHKSWDNCNSCGKRSYCHIFRNRNLLVSNRKNAFDFISKHYSWLNEYGSRLTIRNMTQQLSFMFTGNKNCSNVVEEEPYKYLSSNLFFGYCGTKKMLNAFNMSGIKEANECKYDEKRLRADENLSVKENYKELFSADLEEIINNTLKHNKYSSAIGSVFKRMYFFYNTLSDHTEDYEDIFSKQFCRYLELKYGDSKPNSKDNLLIKNALQMIYTGVIKQNASDLPITLNRESGYVQNVQYVLDEIKLSAIQIESKEIDLPLYGSEFKQNRLSIMIKKKPLDQELTLPLFDYFEELKNGIISTNIDAQLSKGIENIKAGLIDLALQDRTSDNNFTLVVLKDNGDYELVFSAIEDGRLS